MSPKKNNQRLLGYVRVSRAKDDGISPDLQQKAIEAYAHAHGHTVVWLDPDLDESGKSLDRPAMKEALSLLAQGEADGIIAARLDRLTRKVSDLGRLLELAQEQDWNLVAIDLGVDLTTSNGKMVANLLGTVAEWELDRRREAWQDARQNAVERGIHVASQPPAGYSRGEDKRLYPNEHAPVVRKAFEARANGASWHEVAGILTEGGVPTGRNGGSVWTADASHKLLSNRVFLGEARSGSFVNPDAHEAIVSPGLWAKVQSRRREPGSFADPTRRVPLLKGVIRCASCGGAMTLDTTRRNGKVYSFYRCKSQERCTAKATIGQGRVEGYVLSEALERFELSPGEFVEVGVDPEIETQLADVLMEIEELDRQLDSGEINPSVYSRAMTAAERSRDELRQIVTAQTSEGYVQQLSKAAQEERDAARQMLLQLLEPELAEHVAEVVPTEIPKVHRLLRKTLGRVLVAPGRAPVEDRVNFERAG